MIYNKQVCNVFSSIIDGTIKRLLVCNVCAIGADEEREEEEEDEKDEVVLRLDNTLMTLRRECQ